MIFGYFKLFTTHCFFLGKYRLVKSLNTLRKLYQSSMPFFVRLRILPKFSRNYLMLSRDKRRTRGRNDAFCVYLHFTSAHIGI